MADPIVITEADRGRLQELLAGVRGAKRQEVENLDRLEGELERAEIVEPQDVPSNVVTMNSRVRLLDVDRNETMEIDLVYPASADGANGKVSILAPIGTAILGFREGDTVTWPVPGGTRRLRIEKVLSQPEREGNFDL